MSNHASILTLCLHTLSRTHNAPRQHAATNSSNNPQTAFFGDRGTESITSFFLAADLIVMADLVSIGVVGLTAARLDWNSAQCTLQAKDGKIVDLP